MKTIGMIGGMSWESTAVYYRVANRDVQARLGGLHSAKILLWSFDFADIQSLQEAGNWSEASQRMVEAGRALVQGGAQFLIICCNTMHMMADAVEQGAGVPLLHIATPLGAAIARRRMARVGLLGTKYTMEADFLRAPLARPRRTMRTRPIASSTRNCRADNSWNPRAAIFATSSPDWPAAARKASFWAAPNFRCS